MTIEGPLVDVTEAEKEALSAKKKGSNPLHALSNEGSLIKKGEERYLVVSRKLGKLVHWKGSNVEVQGSVEEVGGHSQRRLRG